MTAFYSSPKIMPMIDVLGWIGAACIVSAYFASSYGLFAPNSSDYQIINLAGSVCVSAVSFAKQAWQPAILNVVWALISIGALAH